LVVGMIN